MGEKSLRDAIESSFEEDEEEIEEETTDELDGDGAEAGADDQAGSTDDDDASDAEDEGGDGDEEPVPDVAAKSGDESEGDEEDPSQEEDSIPAPVSWKPAARELWNKLPREAQLEVQRRETEIQRGLQQASGHKKMAQEYFDIVKPYEQLMRANGHTPRQSIEGLLQSAAALQVGNAQQKVAIVTDIIKNYGIDIQMLDNSLAGEELPQSELAPVQQMLQQELAPIRNFMGNFQQQEQRTVQEAQTTMENEVADFAAKNEFFEDVREDMADIMDLAAKRGRSMTLEDAYKKACAEDPEISKVLKQREAAARASRRPRTSDHTGGRKRHAASSVPSSPPSGTADGEGDTSIRGAIERAFDKAEESAI